MAANLYGINSPSGEQANVAKETKERIILVTLEVPKERGKQKCLHCPSHFTDPQSREESHRLYRCGGPQNMDESHTATQSLPSWVSPKWGGFTYGYITRVIQGVPKDKRNQKSLCNPSHLGGLQSEGRIRNGILGIPKLGRNQEDLK